MSEAPAKPNRSLLLGLAAAVALALGVGLLVYRREALPPPPVTLSSAAEPSPAQASPETGAPAEQSSAPAATTASAPEPGAKPGPGQAAPAKPPAVPPATGGPHGTAGAPPPLGEQAMMRRRFVASRTLSENVKAAAKTPVGFDSPPAKRGAEVEGRIEFSPSPTRIRPGDDYKVVVSFVNEGKRAVEIKELTLITTVNGQSKSASVKPLVKAVAQSQNEALYELTGTWDKATTSWGLEVQVTSGRRDVYRNALAWK